MTDATTTAALPTIRVVGGVRVGAGAALGRPLSAAKRQLLAVLVAAGPDGLTAQSLASELGGPGRTLHAPALRMAIARLRDHLPDGWLPDSAAGRYRLVCPVAEVDAWLLAELAASGAVGRVGDDALVQLLLPGAAFVDAGPTRLVDAARHALGPHQRSVLATLLERSPERVDGPLIDHMRRHCADDPYDERLVFLTAARLAGIGDRRGALDRISAARRDLRDVGLDPSARLLELERKLLDGTYDGDAAAPSEPPVARQLPHRLRESSAYGFVGDRSRVDAAFAHLASGAPVLVEGVLGAGKTRFVAELARVAAEHGWQVVDVAGNEAAVDGSLAPFLAALADFRDDAAAVFARHDDPASRRADLWLALRRAIGATAGGARTVLVVDDVQWFDSQSLEFVGHLVGSSGDVAIVFAGRSDAVSRSAWATLRDTAVRSGAMEVALAPMGVEDIREIVRTRHPGLGASTSWGLAEEVHRRGGGWPGTAIVLLASADQDWHLPSTRSLTVPPTLQDSLRSRVSPAAFDVGVAAAVVGELFELDLVQQLCALDADAVLDAVDELVRGELLVERSPTTFATAHALVDAAFLQAASRSQQTRMHLRAASIVGDDVHRRARHLVEALPMADADDVADALLASADAYVQQDLHLEASRRYRSAREVLARPLTPDQTVAYSRALDLSGLHADAERVRDEVHDLAMRAGDAELALRAATSGMPEAEPIDGAPTLVSRLQRIEPGLLRPPSRWVRDHHLARQLAILGELDEAADAADRATLAAVERDEIVASALVHRFAVSATSPPEVRISILDEVAMLVAGMPSRIEGEYWLVRAIDLYEAGDHGGAVDAHARLCAIDGLPIQRRWHAGMFEAMMASDAGDADRARSLRRATYDMASRAGLREAENAYLIGEFVDLFLDGAAGLLLEGVENGSLDPEVNTLMRAGVCAVLDQAGEVGRALPHAELVAKSVLDSPISQGVAALACVARVLGESEDAGLRERAREMLLRRGRSAVVIGAGAACVGPVDHYAAFLAADATMRTAHIAEAQSFAAASGVERWIRVTA